MPPVPMSLSRSRSRGRSILRVGRKRRHTISATPHNKRQHVKHMASRSKSSHTSVAEQQPGTVSVIHMKFGNKTSKIPKNITGVVKYRQIQPVRSTSTFGAQSYTNIMSCCTAGQFITSSAEAVAAGTISAPTQFQSAQAWFDLNPNQKNTGGTLIGVEASPSVDFVYVSYVTATIDLQNQTPVPCEIDLYGWSCTQNTNSAPATIMTFTSDLAMGTAVATQPTAGYAITGTTGNINPQVPGVTPKHVPDFKNFYKIQESKNIKLASGEYKRVFITIGVHQTYSKESIVADYTASTIFMKHKTFGVLARQLGMPVVDVTGGDDICTYGNTQVGMMVNWVTNLHFFTQATKKQPLQQVMWGASVPLAANAKFMNLADASQADFTL